MIGELIERNGVRLLVAATEGAPIGSPRDAADLVGEALSEQAAVVVIPAARLDPHFFRLASGMAGELAQKIVNYRLVLAVVGDIDSHTARSAPLRDFVRESNRGCSVFFLADLEALMEKLAALTP